MLDGSILKARGGIGRLRKYLHIAWNVYQMTDSILTKSLSKVLELRKIPQNAHSYYRLLGSHHQNIKAGQES